jgi:hypothetical protein
MNRSFALAAAAALGLTLTLALSGCAAENPSVQATAAANAAWDAAGGIPASTTAGTPGAAVTAGTGGSAAATAAATGSSTKAAGTGAAAGVKTAAGVTTAKVNEPALVGDWTLTVVGADKQPQDPKGNPAPAGSAILQIDATAANNSKAAMKSPGGDYKLVDSAGTAMKLAASDPGMGYNEGTGVDAVAPGTESAFSMAYVVPSGATGLTFVFTPSTGSKGTLKVTIP